MQEKSAYGSGVPFINVLEVITHSTITENRIPGRIALTAPALNAFAVQRGDVLFNRTSETQEEVGLASVYIGTEAVVFGGFVIRASPRDSRMNSSFTAYALRSPIVRSQIVARGQGAVRANIGQQDLSRVQVVLPTKAEQEAIAEALSDADALIESLEQLLIKKRLLKQGAMQELLTGKKRLPGFGGQWEVKRLGELANIQRGASPRPIDSPIWFDENSSVGWVRISDVTKSGMYLLETTQRLSPLGVQHSRPVSRGNLIMSICATVGRPIVTEIEACIHDGFVVFDNLRTNKHFLYYILQSIESDWSRHGQTGSQMNLNTGLINQTEISVPPTLPEQTAIATILSDMDAEIAALETKLTKARQIKQGMMQELLTGRIRLI